MLSLLLFLLNRTLILVHHRLLPSKPVSLHLLLVDHIEVLCRSLSLHSHKVVNHRLSDLCFWNTATHSHVFMFCRKSCVVDPWLRWLMANKGIGWSHRPHELHSSHLSKSLDL